MNGLEKFWWEKDHEDEGEGYTPTGEWGSVQDDRTGMVLESGPEGWKEERPYSPAEQNRRAAQLMAVRLEAELTHELGEHDQRLTEAREKVAEVEQGLEAAQEAVDKAAQEAVEAKERAQKAIDDAFDATTTAEAAKEAIDQAVQDAKNAAQEAQKAQSDAAAAKHTADTAASDLLALSGKTGRLITSTSAPTGADRNANNLWLNPTRGQLSQWNGSKWVIITDSRLAEATTAAGNAATRADQAKASADAAAGQAADAATKAEQARSQAVAANSAAETAQAAATAAEGTATAARSEASTAAAKAAAAQATADAAARGGGNLVPNGEFLDGSNLWSGAFNDATFADGVLSTPRQNSVMYSRRFSVVAGRTYRVSARTRGGVPGVMTFLQINWFDSDGARVTGEYVVGSHSLTTDWEVIGGDAVAPTQAAVADIALYANHRNGVSDSYQDVDWVSVTDVTDALAAQSVADSAAKAAAEAKAAADQAEAKALGAQADADALDGKMSTLDGKITVSTRNPTASDATDKPEHALWEVRSGTTVLRRFVLVKGSWTPYELGSESLAPASVTTEKTATRPGNLFPDPFFSQDKMWYAYSGNVRVGDDPEMPGGRRLMITTANKAQTGSYYGNANTPVVQIVPGATYRVRATLRAGGNNPPRRWSVFYRAPRDDGTLFTAGSHFDIPSHARFKYGAVEETFTINDDAPEYINFGIYIASPYEDSQTLYVGGVEITRMTDAALIVDGAIQAKHLSAGSVGTDALMAGAITAGSGIIADAAIGTAQIADAAVTNAKIGSLSVSKLTADTSRMNKAAIEQLIGDAAYFKVLQANKIIIAGDDTNKVGATLIENGAITTAKLYATADMWAKLLTVAGDATIGGNLIVGDTIDVSKLRVDAAYAREMAAMMARFQSAFIGKLTAQMIEAQSFSGYEVRGAKIVSPGKAGDITITDNTITSSRLDESGELSETMVIGGADGDSISLTPAPNEPPTVVIDGAGGTASFAGDVSVNDLLVGDSSLLETLRRMPRGLIGWTWGSGAGVPNIGQGAYGLVRFVFPIEHGRRYRVAANLLFEGTPGDVVEFNFYSRAAEEGAGLGSRQVGLHRFQVPTGGVGSAHIEHLFSEDYDHDSYSVAISMRNWATNTRPVSLWGDGGSGRSQSMFYVEDLGHSVGLAGSEWGSLGGKVFTPPQSPSQPPPPPPPPPPVKRTYERTYRAAQVRSWRGSGVVDDVLGHGTFRGFKRVSQILFPPQVRADIGSATIKKVELQLRNLHTGPGSGANVYIGHTGHQGLQGSPSSYATGNAVHHWGKGQRKLVPLSGWTANTQSVWLGVGAPGSISSYAKFSRALSDCVLKVTYEK